MGYAHVSVSNQFCCKVEKAQSLDGCVQDAKQISIHNIYIVLSNNFSGNMVLMN